MNKKKWVSKRKRKMYEINSVFLFSNHDNNTKILIHFRLKGSWILQSLNQTLFHHTIDPSQSQNLWSTDTYMDTWHDIDTDSNKRKWHNWLLSHVSV
jgi:competence transcription factor ComK